MDNLAWDRPYTERGRFRLPLPMFYFRNHYGDDIMNLCECGCGQSVKSGNRFVRGHNGRCISEETREKLRIAHSKSNSGHFKKCHAAWNTGKKFTVEEFGNMGMTGKKHSEESKKRMRDVKKGKILTKETKLKMAISHMKPRSDGYCDVWSDSEFREDLRGSSCECCGITNVMNLKLFGGKLNLHHMDGVKSNCDPGNVMTLCDSCHRKEDAKLIRMRKYGVSRKNN